MRSDRGLMQSCLALSSSESVRGAAAAWLAAYDAALSAGASADEAEHRADRAWQQAWLGPQRRPSMPSATSR